MRLSLSIALSLRFLGVGAGSSESNARRSLYGAMAGIGLSLVPLIVVLVVANGMIEGISARIIELSTSHMRVSDYAGISPIADNPASLQRFAESLVANDGTGQITGAWAERNGTGIVIGPNGRSGGTVRAIQPEFIADPAVAGLFRAVAGDLSLAGPRDALLGEKLAEETGLGVGDRFRLLTLSLRPDGTKIPRFTSWTVTGVVSSGYRELDALWVFLPYETGFEAMSRESSSTFISVRTRDAFGNLDAVRYGLMRSAPEGFNVYSWDELNRGQFQTFNTTRTLLLFIMFLIVLVATVNVSSAVVMLVMERRRDTAILKSTGTDTATISFAFVLAGFLTGLGGVLVGIPLGTLAALHVNGLFSAMERGLNLANRLWYILFPSGLASPPEIRVLDPEYYLQVIPVTLSLRDLALIACGTLLLSVLVSLVPAAKGAGEKPIETMRKF